MIKARWVRWHCVIIIYYPSWRKNSTGRQWDIQNECWTTKKQHVHKMGVAEMRMLRWMCDHTKLDKIRNEDIRKKIVVAPIEKKDERASVVVVWTPTTPVSRCTGETKNLAPRRCRGRQKITRGEVIKRDLKERNITEDLVCDRDISRSAIRTMEIE